MTSNHNVRTAATALLLLTVAVTVAAIRPPAAAPRPSPGNAEFAAFVDQYLLGFARRHPSIAAGNGIHDYDGTLDDFSAAAITREITELKRDRARLRAFTPSQLSADERVDQKILDGVIDGWLLEQETLQNWKRNPMLYASALSDGVHNLMTMEYAPAPVRMRRIIGKLAGVPQLLAAARTNVAEPAEALRRAGRGHDEGRVGHAGERCRARVRDGARHAAHGLAAACGGRRETAGRCATSRGSSAT